MILLNVHNPARDTTFSLRISICIWHLIYPMKTSFTCRWRGQSQEGQMLRPHSQTLHKLFARASGPGAWWVQEMLGHGEFLSSNREDGHRNQASEGPEQTGGRSLGDDWNPPLLLPNFLLCDSCFPDPISLGTSGDLSENHRGFWIWAPPRSLPGPQVPGPAGAC